MAQTRKSSDGRLRRIRREQSISLNEAAVRAGISEPMLSKMERQPVPIERAKKILRAIGAHDALFRRNPVIELAQDATSDERGLILGLAFIDAIMEGVTADPVQISKTIFGGKKSAEWVSERIEKWISQGFLTRKHSGLRVNFNAEAPHE